MESWALTHMRDTGHQTEETMTGMRCLQCYAKPPVEHGRYRTVMETGRFVVVEDVVNFRFTLYALNSITSPLPCTRVSISHERLARMPIPHLAAYMHTGFAVPLKNTTLLELELMRARQEGVLPGEA